MQNKKIQAEEIEKMYQNIAELCRDLDLERRTKSEHLQDLAKGLVDLYGQVDRGEIIEPKQLSYKLLEIEDKFKEVRDQVEIPFNLSKHENLIIKMTGDVGRLAREVPLNHNRKLYLDAIGNFEEIPESYLDLLNAYGSTSKQL